jgi:hypothetical protein
MIVNTPYTEVYIRKSHLSGDPVYNSKDDLIFGVLIGIRFISHRSPLYIAYIPYVGAVYDKIDQCAIFNKPSLDFKYSDFEEIKQSDVAWWDCIGNDWQLITFNVIKNIKVEMTNRSGKLLSGTYLWTCDPQNFNQNINYSQSEVWNEHKTKNYFFDEVTGVLCCAPNNKIKWIDSSLSPSELEPANWLRVYNDLDDPSRTTHEDSKRFGDANYFSYHS